MFIFLLTDIILNVLFNFIKCELLGRTPRMLPIIIKCKCDIKEFSDVRIIAKVPH